MLTLGGIECKKDEEKPTTSTSTSTSGLPTKTTAPTGIDAGNAAPEFTSQDVVDGSSVSLASLRGKYVLLLFLATWAGGDKNISDLTPIYNKFKDKKDTKGYGGFTIVGIASEPSSDKLKQMATQAPWHIVSGTTNGGDILEGESFYFNKTKNIPATWLIDPHGEIIVANGDDPENPDLMQDDYKLLISKLDQYLH